MTIQSHIFEISGLPRNSRFPDGPILPPPSGNRNRQLHPFPEDDPFNMPLGTNVYYAPIGDPATDSVRNNAAGVSVNNGWSLPFYTPSPTDPVTHLINRPSRNFGRQTMWSYIPEEHRKVFEINIPLPLNAMPAIPASYTWRDGWLIAGYGNDLIETWVFNRLTAKWVPNPDDGTQVFPGTPDPRPLFNDNSGQPYATVYKIVRNRFDRYSFGMGHGISHPMRNVAGVRAWGGVGLAGLTRKHEVEKAEPHIPHALTIALDEIVQLSGYQQGPSSSPLYSVAMMFPAGCHDWGCSATSKYATNSTGPCRMGMRFALDPTICTDAWINQNAPNIHQAALARALRDYGAIVVDGSYSSNVIQAEQGTATAVAANLVNHPPGSQWPQGWNWCKTHMRRVAGRLPDGTVVHNPLESHWQTWAENGQGWGGGAPRVPYSDPLAPL